MNFEWKKIAERGQYEIGFIDVYQLVYKLKAIAIINYLPQFEQKKQRGNIYIDSLLTSASAPTCI